MVEKYFFYFYFLGATVIFIVTWNLFDWFSWSIKDTFNSTRWDHFKKKFTASLINAILIPLVLIALYLKLTSPNTITSVDSAKVTDSPSPGSAPGYTGPDSAALITKQQLLELQKKYKEKNINN